MMDRIVRHMTSHQHRLVFCTRSGKPDTHLWDKVKSLAKRANLDSARFNLKKFRATRMSPDAIVRPLRDPSGMIVPMLTLGQTRTFRVGGGPFRSTSARASDR